MTTDDQRQRAGSALMGLELHAVRETEVIERVLAGVARGSGGWVCPVNVDVLRQCHNSPELRDLVRGADLVVADGMPLIWASRLAGEPLPERVAGSSLIFSLTAAAARHGAPVYLLGGNPGTADGAAKRLSERDPELRVAGTSCPPIGFERDPAELAAIERDLERTDPSIVFVGLGFPKQDRLVARLRERFPQLWFLSAGISFSYVSGDVRRAPAPLRAAGLEWLHRLAQEPRRLFRRYLVDGSWFTIRMLTAAARRRVRLTAVARRYH